MTSWFGETETDIHFVAVSRVPMRVLNADCLSLNPLELIQLLKPHWRPIRFP